MISNNSRRDRARGFTIIEFIIVIALIAILTGVIVPMFFTSTTRARDMKLVTGADSIANALRMYMMLSGGPYDSYGNLVSIDYLISKGHIPEIDPEDKRFYFLYFSSGSSSAKIKPTVSILAAPPAPAENSYLGDWEFGYTWDSDPSTGIFKDASRSMYKKGVRCNIAVVICGEDNNKEVDRTIIRHVVNVLNINT